MKLSTAFLLLSQLQAVTYAGKGSLDSLPTLTDNIHPPDLSNVQKGDSCLSGSGFTVSTEKCTFDALSEALESLIALECPHADGDRELQYILDGDAAAVKSQIEQACLDGWEAHKTKYEYPWSKVSGYGDKWDKEYYDGNSNWNEAYETIVDAIDPNEPGNHLKTDAHRVRSLYDGEAQYYPIESPDHLDNFDDCQLRSMMCCWTSDRQAGDNNGNCATPYDANCVDADPGDNTDLCLTNMDLSTQHNHVDGGFAMFPGDNSNAEGPIHCHGLAWGKDDMEADARYKANNLFYVSMYDHMYQRGYVRNVPGAPMCGCVEKMPKVSRSDCTEIDAEEQWLFTWDTVTSAFVAEVENVKINFNACQGYNNQNNNLEAFYRRLAAEDRVSFEDFTKFKKTVVGDNKCQRTIDAEIIDAGFEYVPEPTSMSKFTQIEGVMDSVAVSYGEEVVMGLTNDGTLLEYSYGTWITTDDDGKKFASISLADNGNQVWAVTRGGDVMLRDNGEWTEFERRIMKSISVSNDGDHVWAINYDNEIFYRQGENGYWEQVEGQLKQLSVNHDGSTIWAVNKNHQIYYRKGLEDSWNLVSGSLSHVSAFGNEGVWGAQDDGDIYTRETVSTSWVQQTGILSMVSSSFDKNVMWGVDKFNRVWSFGGPKLKDLGANPNDSDLPLQRCEGNCADDSECDGGMFCFKWDDEQYIPGCSGTGKATYGYCSLPELKDLGVNPSQTLQLCEGDCDEDEDCADGMKCFQRSGFAEITGCIGSGLEDYDYCYYPEYYPELKDYGPAAHETHSPLAQCEGDCDTDSNCGYGMHCIHRDGFSPIPGCTGKGVGSFDYCSYYELEDVSKTTNLQECEGDCNSDSDCAGDLKCIQRDGFTPIQGCVGKGTKDTDYCSYLPLAEFGSNPSKTLNQCEGDCDNDSECAGDLMCFQRNGFTSIPGCVGAGLVDYDYCYSPDIGSPELKDYGGDPSQANLPLKQCEGDCDTDSDCEGRMKCFQRDDFLTVPGCRGNGVDNFDYCYYPEAGGAVAGAFTSTANQEELVEGPKNDSKDLKKAAKETAKEGGMEELTLNVMDEKDYEKYMDIVDESGVVGVGAIEERDSNEGIYEYPEIATPDELTRDAIPERDPDPVVATEEEYVFKNNVQ